MDEPIMPTEELDRLIEQTAREIQILEKEEEALAKLHVEDDEDQVSDASTPLVSLQVPEAPVIRRKPTAAAKSWAKRRQELLDPTEVTRAFLDRQLFPETALPELSRWQLDPNDPKKSVSGLLVHCTARSYTDAMGFDPIEEHLFNLAHSAAL